MNSNDSYDKFPTYPFFPPNAIDIPDGQTLSSVRDVLSGLEPDRETADKLLSVIDRWQRKPNDVNPIQDMQQAMEHMRSLPPGDHRLKCMNTLVRTLGQPETLATYLDMLRDSAERQGTQEQKLCKVICQDDTMHAMYGWCAQTLILESITGPTPATIQPVPGLEESLGITTPEWGLAIHVWQPNPVARGFTAQKRYEPDVIVEPPHTHPYNFVSMLVTGEIHHSVYEQLHIDSESITGADSGRYAGVSLEHVNGVWPPHYFRKTCALRTLEDRVPLRAGESYYMPCHWIHDVEVEAKMARTQPAITLFLSSEAIVNAHTYMIKSMADFHDQNPVLKKRAKALPPHDWHCKMSELAAYLRGTIPVLDLSNIVKHTEEYAFFHVS